MKLHTYLLYIQIQYSLYKTSHFLKNELHENIILVFWYNEQKSKKDNSYMGIAYCVAIFS